MTADKQTECHTNCL